MTQTKIGASHFKGRLFKSAVSSTLAFSALAGGVMLSGGNAKAECIPGPLATQSVSYTDIGINFTDTTKNIKDSLLPGTKCQLELTGLKLPDNQKNYDIDYNGALTQQRLTDLGLTPNPTADVVEYTINKIGFVNGSPVKVWFDQVSLSATIEGTGATVQKLVYATEADFLNKTNSIADLLIDKTEKKIAALPNKYDHLWIRDIMTPGNGSIDNVFNYYRDVPGPLPVLGASLALGSVRKLRNLTSRLKVHSMA